MVRLVGPGTTVATIGDHIEVTTSAPSTIQLPDPALYLGKRVSVKDGSGSAGTNTITISTPLGGNIDGLGSASIIKDKGAKEFQSNGTDWKVISDYEQTVLATVGLTVTASSGTFAGVPDNMHLVDTSAAVATCNLPVAFGSSEY